MTVTNVGNQSVFFNYQKDLTGAIVNAANEDLLRVGPLSGMEVTRYDDTHISLATGKFVISDGTYTVVVHKGANHEILVDGTSEYIVARYSYSAAEFWYAEFVNTASVLANDIILGKIVYAGGLVSSIDNSENDNGHISYDNDVLVTALGYNRYLKDLIEDGTFGTNTLHNWTDLLTNSWFHNTEEQPIQELYADMFPVLTFDNTKNRYVYFWIRTGANVDVLFNIKYTTSIAAVSKAVKLKLDYMVMVNGLSGLSSAAFAINTTEAITVADTEDSYTAVTTTTLKLPSSVSTTPNRLILCRLSRDYADGADTYAGDFKILSILPVTS